MLKTGTILYKTIGENLLRDCSVEDEFPDTHNDGQMFLELLRKEGFINEGKLSRNFVLNKFFVSQNGKDRRVL